MGETVAVNAEGRKFSLLDRLEYVVVNASREHVGSDASQRHNIVHYVVLYQAQ